MTFKYEDKQYRIIFKHNTRYALPTDPNVMVKGTRCDIEIPFPETAGTTYHPMVYSYCHPSDNFCKETGRKLALAKALRSYSRKFRTAAWEAYLERPRGVNQQHLDRLLKNHGLTEESVAKARQKLLATAAKDKDFPFGPMHV